VAILGLSRRDPNVEEAFVAVRLLLETVARERALLVVFDDVQWAATTFLDLVEYLRHSVHGLRLLVVCMARPELNDVRPALTEGGQVLTVGPLDDQASVLLIERMLHASLPVELSGRIVEAAEGNPLFVEELIRMLIDDGTLGKENGVWKALSPVEDFAVPPTIQAILGARLDRLGETERAVIETASVIGETFSRAAVLELCCDSVPGELGDELEALERKGLIRAWSASDLEDEDSFRFGHVLIRDAAYAGLLKEARSQVHRRLAGWLEETTKASTYEEIIGFHLEQAYRHRSELGPPDQAALGLAARASGYLASAGRRASARGDISAADGLLSRALSLLPPGDRARSALAIDFAEVMYDMGRFNEADQLIEEAIDAPKLHRRSALIYRSSFLRLKLRLVTDPEGIADQARRELEQAIPALEQAEDERSLARALLLKAELDNWACRFVEMEASARRGLEYARRSGDERAEADLLFQLLMALQMGPTPVADVIAEAEARLREAEGRPNVEGMVLGILGWSCAVLGQFDDARELSNRAKAILEEFRGDLTLAGGAPQVDAEIEMLADNPAAAERELRRGYEDLRRMGERSFLSTVAALLSTALHAQGKDAEAERLSHEAEEAAASDDVASQILWRTARARILAARQQLDEAERLARGAVALAEDIDAYFRADAFVALAEVQRGGPHPDNPGDLIQRALAVYLAKGNIVAAQKTRRLLDRLPESETQITFTET
jgi:predicted ATPase